jgi:hypothetical protein
VPRRAGYPGSPHGQRSLCAMLGRPSLDTLTEISNRCWEKVHRRNKKVGGIAPQGDRLALHPELWCSTVACPLWGVLSAYAELRPSSALGSALARNGSCCLHPSHGSELPGGLPSSGRQPVYSRRRLRASPHSDTSPNRWRWTSTGLRTCHRVIVSLVLSADGGILRNSLGNIRKFLAAAQGKVR